MDRRTFILAAPIFLVGCNFRHPLPKMVPINSEKNGEYIVENSEPEIITRKNSATAKQPLARRPSDPRYAGMTDNGFFVRAIDTSRINPELLRQEVAFSLPYNPGTIVVDPTNFFCYFVLPNKRAIRYGVGVARSSATDFQGEATIGRKAIWPSWHPTATMVKQQPQRYGHLADGMQGGPNNPLGARALYLYRDGADTLFRLHGTVEPWSIGKRVSSGCIRFFNQDIIELYDRVPVGARAVVLPHKIGLG